MSRTVRGEALVWGSILSSELSGVLGVKNKASACINFLSTSDSYECIVYNCELQKSVNNSAKVFVFKSNAADVVEKRTL